jgi:hypothetical protein
MGYPPPNPHLQVTQQDGKWVSIKINYKGRHRYAPKDTTRGLLTSVSVVQAIVVRNSSLEPMPALIKKKRPGFEDLQERKRFKEPAKKDTLCGCILQD